MSWIQREECVQYHNAAAKKGKKSRRWLFFQLTIPHSAGISSDLKIYSKPDWQRSPMPCTEIRVYTRYPSKTLRKTISLSPPRNFPPLVTKFLPERKTLPSVPRTAHLSTQQKVCSYHVSGTSSKGQKRIVVHYKEKTKQLIKSVNVRPLGETSVSRVYFFRRQSSLCYSDALSGLLDFFPPPYVSTHTALLLPSSACHHPPSLLLSRAPQV